MSRRAAGFLGLVLGWVLLDQWTKAAIVAAYSPSGAHRTELTDWLALTLTYNPGAAFGLFNSHGWARYLFILVAVGALAGMVIWRRPLLALPGPQRAGLALVAAGAAGNLLDRLVRDGLVVDFIHFHLDTIGFVWPDFNIADIGVTCGMALYVSHSLWWEARLARQAAPHSPPSPEPAPGVADAPADGH